MAVLNNAIWRKVWSFSKTRGWDFPILHKIKLDHEDTPVTYTAFIKT